MKPYYLFSFLLSILTVHCTPQKAEPKKDTPKTCNAPPLLANTQKVRISPLEPENALTENWGFRLFQQVCNENDTNSNIFVSPISLQVALGMLSQGASGTTLEEIHQFMGLREATDTQRLQYFQNMSRHLNVSTPNTTLKLANAIWVQHPNSPKPEFATLAKNVFQSEINTFSYETSSQAIKDINHWCDKITQHKIPTIIENIDSNDVMLLLNALYFKSKWKQEFESGSTRLQPFYAAAQSVDTVSMMHQTEYFKYAENDSVQILEIPYTNPRFSMIILLPKKEFTSFLHNVHSKNWSKWLGGFNTVKVNLTLPKFKIEFAAPLNEPLQHLQMTTPFDRVKANFTKLCYQDSIYISKIFQKTFIEVNERGVLRLQQLLRRQRN